MSRLIRALDDNDVVERLRYSVEKAGGQSAFAGQTGIDRTHLNHTLTGKRLPSWSIVDALNLGVVYVPLGQYDGLAVRKLTVRKLLPRRRRTNSFS
jgi:DNA-binding phage protein